MIRWNGLAPCEFEFTFPDSLTSTFLDGTAQEDCISRKRIVVVTDEVALIPEGAADEGRGLSKIVGLAGFGGRSGEIFFFFFTLVTGPRRSLSLKLSDTRVYAPQIRAHLGTTAGEF